MTKASMVVMDFPGASIMDIEQRDDGGLKIHCPGCDETWIIAPAKAGEVRHISLDHYDNCPTKARIDRALALLDRMIGAEEN